MSDEIDELLEEAVFLMEDAVFGRPVPGVKLEPGPCKCFKIPASDGYTEKDLCFRSGVLGTLTQEQNKKLCPEEQRIHMTDGLGKRIAILRRASTICKTQVTEKEKGTRWPLWWSCMGKTLPKIAREIEKEPVPVPPPVPPPAPKPTPKPEVKPPVKPVKPEAKVEPGKMTPEQLIEKLRGETKAKPKPKPKPKEEEEEEEGEEE